MNLLFLDSPPPYEPHVTNPQPQVTQPPPVPMSISHVENNHPPIQINDHDESQSNHTDNHSPQQNESDTTAPKPSLGKTEVFLDNFDEI